MTVYIAGKITGDNNYREKFRRFADVVESRGDYEVINPALLPAGMERGKTMLICFAMIDAADAVYFMKDWRESEGARAEYQYAMAHNKLIKVE